MAQTRALAAMLLLAIAACDGRGTACEPVSAAVIENSMDGGQADGRISRCLHVQAYKLAAADLPTPEITASVLDACDGDIALRNALATEQAEREHQKELEEWRKTAPKLYAHLTRAQADAVIRSYKEKGDNAFPGGVIPGYVLANVRPGDPGWQEFLSNGPWGPPQVVEKVAGDYAAEAHRRVVEAKAGKCWRHL